MLLSYLIALLIAIPAIQAFVPANFVNKVIAELNKNYKDNLAEVDTTITHDDMIKRGKLLITLSASIIITALNFYYFQAWLELLVDIFIIK